MPFESTMVRLPTPIWAVLGRMDNWGERVARESQYDNNVLEHCKLHVFNKHVLRVKELRLLFTPHLQIRVCAAKVVDFLLKAHHYQFY